MFTKQDHISYWLITAQRDIESAEAIYLAGKYDWSLFVGHLALEKLLKAFWVKNNEENIPPKIHDLVKIANQANFTLTEEEKLFLLEVNEFNIEGRYPDYKLDFLKKCTPEFSQQYLKKIKEFYECTRKKI